MTWLLTLSLVLLTTLIGLHLWALVYLWRTVHLLQTMQRNLDQWERPASLASPAVEPGTSWVMSERELARREREMLAASEKRGTVVAFGSKKSKPNSANRKA